MSTNHDWLNLIEVSGPFLAVPVLRDVLPQGLEALISGRPQRLRAAYDEWRDAVDAVDADLTAIHSAWIDEVLQSALEVDDQVLRQAATLPERLKVSLPEHGVTIAPDLAIVNPTQDDAPLLLVQLYDPDTDLDATRNYDGLATTPGDRMVSLLRAVGCPIGLVTNGERWMLVHAPAGAVASFASWYARLWGQEPETLRAFVSLLGVRRFFGPEAERLPALFERSLKHQDDVTDALGEQVRRAVEVLVQSLDRADQDRNRDLLHDVDPKELYEAGLTVMMRLVFLLAAEERGLLLLGDPRYDAFYALSSLRMQLRADTEEILERRRSAWSRLLALFRGVYGGIDHSLLRLPAMGGSLFDPDRYPFLEGRKKGTNWRSDPAEPLPIDDRTVLLLLEAIQTFEGRTLSYRALDVEQIGHVYEGLLERTVQRVDDVTLELDGSTKAKNARVALGEIESARLDGAARIVDLLKERSERSEPAIRNAIGREPDERVAARLLTVCRGDVALRDRILPFAELLRTDPWGYPLVHHAGAFVVVLGADRRESGTHYTPKSLTEKIVEETLTPIVYRGPAEGAAREDWKLKSADELLDLKVCDPAMGSGAFLVQACRWLADRLVEAWSNMEAAGGRIDDEGRIRPVDDTAGFEPLARDTEERAILARRLIAERCLYGVDKNPLAVELAKLSLWLTTLAKGRPFGFLDHSLRSGDSLLGIHDLGQLIELEMKPKGKAQLRLFGRTIRSAVDKALALRSQLRSIPIRDIGDVEAMAALDAQSRSELALPGLIADALIGLVLTDDRSVRITTLATMADEAAGGDANARIRLLRQATADLANDAPDRAARRPIHWPLEFPEVFLGDESGFDAIIGNPPFLGGRRMRAALGDGSLRAFTTTWPHASLNADLCAFFFLRANQITRPGGAFGLIATKSIGEGDTGRTGLASIIADGSHHIRYARSSFRWPGSAAVVTALVVVQKDAWQGGFLLDETSVAGISSSLEVQSGWTDPKPLLANKGRSFQGSVLVGNGFVLSGEEAANLIQINPNNSDVILRYIGGSDINTNPTQEASRWAIDFRDRSLSECEEKYPEPLKIVRDLVKPQRDTVRRDAHRIYWWHHGDKRPALYKAIRKNKSTFVLCLHTKYLAISQVDSLQIFQHSLGILNVENWQDFACLQSSIHDSWARQASSSLGDTLRYTLTDSFETFPFIIGHNSDVDSIGKEYHNFRKDILTSRQIGITAAYNIFHNPTERDQEIGTFRDLRIAMDAAVVSAYGWNDLDLQHGFHEVPYLPESDRVRFTISEAARAEVLRRLSELNRQRHAQEVKAGSHKAEKKSASGRKRSIRDVGDLFNPGAVKAEAVDD
ncbi:hypothetical protein GGR25_000269 [Kaistia hirudinis]|uniref:site-specific DNA-methyltransferase (adenine-specific) n=1 Tax=Kaistia hirudinis TaxID=1293440 RepID=A0A840AGI9_9HYPH|nr:DNA methyltransferase [Kaistia hirudinis]MBB3929250.1 hypothetical protein [Kaistia hirudinis]